MAENILINSNQYKIPTNKEETQSFLSVFEKKRAADLKQAHFLALESETEEGTQAYACFIDTNSEALCALLLELGSAAALLPSGFCEGILEGQQMQQLKKIAELPAFAEQLPNQTSLRKLISSSSRVGYEVFAAKSEDAAFERIYSETKINTLFELFNLGALRGSDPEARQALLDSFKVLPNRYLSANGAFIDIGGGGEHFVAGIDKFPSLMSVRAAQLLEDGNRIVPGAMIRNGVHVGKRNIFMFHAAVNIAAFVGDDNLIDSHASLGSAAQLGNGNKIGSFVSLEGVLSPANAVGVLIGNHNFLGSFVRIGAGISIADNNFIGAGVNISLGTKIKDCRSVSASKGQYITPRELNTNFNNLCIAPNNAEREFHAVKILPGEYILFENDEDFRTRFEGDMRIKAKI